jgi:hypothetical protein
LIPKRSIIVGFQDNLQKIDRSALNYNEILDSCRVIGISFFCAGSSLMLIFLVVYHVIVSHDEVIEEDTVCRLKHLHDPEETIPVDEKISRIQPESWGNPNVY